MSSGRRGARNSSRFRPNLRENLSLYSPEVVASVTAIPAYALKRHDQVLSQTFRHLSAPLRTDPSGRVRCHVRTLRTVEETHVVGQGGFVAQGYSLNQVRDHDGAHVVTAWDGNQRTV
jgi:hypothetical protein